MSEDLPTGYSSLVAAFDSGVHSMHSVIGVAVDVLSAYQNAKQRT